MVDFLNGTTLLFTSFMGVTIFIGGLVGGLVFGAIPGLNILTLAAVLLPFTAWMSAEHAIMLYGVLAIGAAVLFEARGFSVALALVMASLVLILIRDLGAALPVRSGSPWADFGFAALIVLVTGLGSY